MYLVNRDYFGYGQNENAAYSWFFKGNIPCLSQNGHYSAEVFERVHKKIAKIEQEQNQVIMLYY